MKLLGNWSQSLLKIYSKLLYLQGISYSNQVCIIVQGVHIYPSCYSTPTVLLPVFEIRADIE